MFHTRDIVTAIEIGTSKINVLVGEAGPDGRVNVVGRGSAPSAGSVVKGEIEDMDLAFEQLGNAIADAESASDGLLNSTKVDLRSYHNKIVQYLSCHKTHDNAHKRRYQIFSVNIR